MTGFAAFRVATIGLVWAMSIVVLGLAANSIALSVGTVWLFPNLALAVSIATHAVVTPLLLISLAKTGAFTSKVIVEISWIGVLWMLWLAVSVVTTSTPVFLSSCIEYQTYFGSQVASECMQFTWLQAASWFITALLLLYSVTLFTLALLSNMWRHKESPNVNEKHVPVEDHANAFFNDASALQFFCAPLTKHEQEQEQEEKTTGASLQRADTKVAPLFAGAHPYWTTCIQGDSSPGGESRLERGRSTSTVGSITKAYIPSPLGRPQRAILPSQSPYLNTRGCGR